MQPGLELARRTTAGLARRDLGPRVAVGAGVIAAIAFSFFLAALPVSSLLGLAGLGVACAAVASLPWPKRDPTELYPDEIADPILRATYGSIITARHELERALASAPGFATTAASIEERCRDAVKLCARIAPVANRLHAYLNAHDTWTIAREAAQLRTRCKLIKDQPTVQSLAQAATAYERQLATCDELLQTRERIQARLDLVLASLRAFTAAVIKQQTCEDEQFALAGESLTDHVEGVRQELAVLESALQVEAA